ncbi:uncharacterized protein LOC112553240 isoform X2 [Pomacea canaliculata]|nr:uncharacterized protein LOC112553240 isoform X2 [Pomacea canaliculata]
MPKKRTTRVNRRAKPKAPGGDLPDNLELEDKRRKLNVFLQDFEIEVKNRLQAYEKEKGRLQKIIEKEIELQLSALPQEIRNMNIMDFVAAGGTVKDAWMKLEEKKDLVTQMEADIHREHLTQGFTSSKKFAGKNSQRGRGPVERTNMPPPSATLSSLKQSRFRTPLNKNLQHTAWETLAVTPKFDINLPFTPGTARAPRNGERFMSLAGSPIEISTNQRTVRAQKYSKIEEEDNIESAVSKLAVEVPDLAKADIRRVLTLYTAAKMASE